MIRSLFAFRRSCGNRGSVTLMEAVALLTLAGVLWLAYFKFAGDSGTAQAVFDRTACSKSMLDDSAHDSLTETLLPDNEDGCDPEAAPVATLVVPTAAPTATIVGPLEPEILPE